MGRRENKIEAKVDLLNASTALRCLAWLEDQPGYALVSDDAGRWACVTDGMQNVPDTDGPSDISTTFFIKAAEWHDTIFEAIDATMRKTLG